MVCREDVDMGEEGRLSRFTEILEKIKEMGGEEDQSKVIGSLSKFRMGKGRAFTMCLGMVYVR